MLNNVEKIAIGLNKKYPNGNHPFQIITRLAEECGELAKEVNHFENTGRKIEKYGQPNKNKLAKEVQYVIRSALQISLYYKIENEFKKSIEKRLEKLKQDKFI